MVSVHEHETSRDKSRMLDMYSTWLPVAKGDDSCQYCWQQQENSVSTASGYLQFLNPECFLDS
jgi:hypothetical protein